MNPTTRQTAQLTADLNAGYWGEWEVAERVGRLHVLVHPVSGRVTEVDLPAEVQLVGGRYRAAT